MSRAPLLSTPVHPRPAPLAAIRAGRLAVVEASAGTGKTFLLVHLVADLVLEGTPLDRILVVTFTEKATHEMRHRVRALLETLLAEARGQKAPPAGGDRATDWVLDGRAALRLESAIAGLDRATIATIHGFCQRVLTEHAFAHGRLLEQQTIESRGAFTAAFHAAARERLLTDPALAPWLLAGLLPPGDTHGHSDRIESLLFDAHRRAAAGAVLGPPFDPDALRAAALSFAALEMEVGAFRRASKLVNVNGNTANAIARRLEALHAHCRTLAGDGDLAAFLSAVEHEGPGFFSYVRDAIDKVRATWPALAERWEALDAQVVPLAAAQVAMLLPAIVERLEARKQSEGLYDFQDMLNLVARSLEGPHGDALANSLRRRYDVALIDEFQDTDDVQWRIFRRLFADQASAGPAGLRLAVIGDPKQAIYGFRGADVATYLEARAAMVAAGGVEVFLDRNFRATPAMLDACNTFFADPGVEIGDTSFFKGDIRYLHPLLPGRPHLRLEDATGRAIDPVRVLRFEPRSGDLRAGEVRATLGRQIARSIAALLATPHILKDEAEARVLTARDIFVLTRSTAETYEIAEALRAARLPHVFHRGDGLFQTDEARAVRTLLAALDDPGDRAKRALAFLSPFFALRLDELALTDLPPHHPAMERLFTWSARAARGDWEGLFAHLLGESGVVRRELFLGQGARSATNLRHIFEFLLREQGHGHASARDLVLLLDALQHRRLALDSEEQNELRREGERDAVSIMTMHKSKGLEAAVVFLYGGFSAFGGGSKLHTHHQAGARHVHVGRPDDAALDAAIRAELADEDRRLLYVGLTRAKGLMVLSYFPTVREVDAELEGHPDADEESFKKLEGAWRHANLRLRVLLESPPPGFVVEHVLCPDVAPAVAPPAERAIAAPERWQPPPSLLNAEDPRARLAALRQAHRGPLVTSYSQLARLRERDLLDEAGPAEGAEPRLPLAADELPGGAAVGIFLHELLEELSPVTPRGPDGARLPLPPLPSWRALPAVATLLDRVMRRHDIAAAHRANTERLVHAALTDELPGRDGQRISGLDRLPRPPSPEVEFLYPRPRGHDFVTGIVDLIFEHDGLVYGLDWKSDRLPERGPDAATLRAHVNDHYQLQLRLYVLALVKALAITDEPGYEKSFGGFIYRFLRVPGLGGSVFLRPSWADVQTWIADLSDDPRWAIVAA